VTCAIGRMARTRSRSSSGRRHGGAALAACVVVLALSPAAAHGQQDDADAACAALLTASTVAECRLAVGAARVIQPRLGAALFGGSAVPGTASTLGMRLGSFPRLSLAFRLTGAPTEVPPILNRQAGAADPGTALLVGVAADAAVGILGGFSPLPTVGGVLSLDLIARAGVVPLPGSRGFDDGGAWGVSLGARVGALRESFTLPGVSLTGSYARISSIALGDPERGTTDGFFDGGAITDLRAALAATKRLGPVGLTGGVAVDRYSSDLEAGFRDGFGGPQLQVEGDAVHDRWSAYAGASWTLLIFHASVELGWQEAPVPDGIPADVELDPIGWFGGAAFRISI
jgi:hypothetical protein